MYEILVIDDDEQCLEILREYLLEAGCVPVTVHTPKEAFPLLKNGNFDVILCDLHMPFALDHETFDFPYSVEVGVRTIEELRIALPGTPIVGMTAGLDGDKMIIGKRLEMVPVLKKPFNAGTLLRALEGATQKNNRVEHMH